MQTVIKKSDSISQINNTKLSPQDNQNSSNSNHHQLNHNQYGSFNNSAGNPQRQKLSNGMAQQFKQIRQRLRSIIKAQQQDEESIRQQYELGQPQFELSGTERAIMQKVRDALPELKDCLLVLFKAEITVDVLIESGIAKTLKYFQDYCRLYEPDLPEFKVFLQQSEHILQKWKNYVMTTVFDDKKDFQLEFQKNKYLKSSQKKLNRKNPSKQKQSKNTTMLGENPSASLHTQQQSMLCKALMRFEGDDNNEERRSHNERSNSIYQHNQYKSLNGYFNEEHKHGAGTDSNDSLMVDMSADGGVTQHPHAGTQIAPSHYPSNILGKQAKGDSPNKTPGIGAFPLSAGSSQFQKPSTNLNRQHSGSVNASAIGHEQTIEHYNNMSKVIEQIQQFELLQQQLQPHSQAAVTRDPNEASQSLMDRFGSSPASSNNVVQNLLLMEALKMQIRKATNEKVLQTVLQAYASVQGSAHPHDDNRTMPTDGGDSAGGMQANTSTNSDHLVLQ